MACKHLEKELAKVYSRDSVHADCYPNIESFPGARLGDRKEAEAEAMNTRLLAYAIPELHRQVVVYHLVFNWSFQDIALTLSIPSKQTAHNIFRRAVDQLRERGYGK
jgi:DNA-directed RNA polymerase specialized sigma24 family protein